ncbi:hypothetical protein GJ496_008656 [Pomphorhynchus laevis]|nr:hypothetical protein GJ496_008656 [Pomphorhynchus laevis]
MNSVVLKVSNSFIKYPRYISLDTVNNIVNNDDNITVFDKLFENTIPRTPILPLSEDNSQFAYFDFNSVRTEFRANAKYIKALPFKNDLFLSPLTRNLNGDNPLRSDYRKMVIYSIHEYRRQWRNRPVNTLRHLILESLKPNTSIWRNYHQHINENGLPRDDSAVQLVINTLKFGEVTFVDEIKRGTQIKLQVTFLDGTIAVVKPMRVSRHYQTPVNHFYFTDIERHNAEIAAYHLDRILRFNRAPPTVGRRFNISKEIKPNAHENLLSTFFISPAGNECFRGQCKSYCDTTHAVCGINKNIMEASVQLYLPVMPMVSWIRMTHPYRRSYSTRNIAEWENNPGYCVESVFTDESFHSRLILDMIDSSVFDFLIGNLDRHHLTKIDELGTNSTTFHIDQGRAFGRYMEDDLSILAPLSQCCLLRFSTMEMLSKFALSGQNSLENAANSISDKDDTYHLSGSSTDVSLKELESLRADKKGSSHSGNEQNSKLDDESYLIDECSLDKSCYFGSEPGPDIFKYCTSDRKSYIDSIVSCPAELVNANGNFESFGFKYYNVNKPTKSWRRQPMWIDCESLDVASYIDSDDIDKLNEFDDCDSF